MARRLNPAKNRVLKVLRLTTGRPHCKARPADGLDAVAFRFLIAANLLIATIAPDVPAHAGDTRKSINTMAQLLAALRQCWIPPPTTRSHDGMEITIRFSLTRDGRVFGRAAIRYESPDASDDERLAYRISVAQAIERCTPFPITEGFGNAIAGHPLNIKLTDRRGQRSANFGIIGDDTGSGQKRYTL
jgi:hypothetical protein